MLKPIRNYFVNNLGALAPMAAVMLPLILGLTGVGVDVSVWVQNQRDMQAAVDSAVIAAAWEVAHDFSEDEAKAAGLKEAINNGYANTADNDLDITFDTNDDGNIVVSGSITSKETQYFSQVLYQGDIYATVVAASAVVLPDGGYCMLSLDPEVDGAITASGTVDIDSAGCGIAVNSSGDLAFDVNGSVDILIDSLSVVGGIDVGNNVDLVTNSTKTGADPVQDPYDDLEAPSGITPPADCDYTNYSTNSNAAVTIPHVDSTGDGMVVYCGGIRISGNGAVTFAAGVYILYAGDLQITGNNGSITAVGVSFILTGSNADGWGNVEIAGGKDMNFVAPLDGALSAPFEDFEGMAFYQDRNAPTIANCNTITGSSAVDITGAAYFPNRCLDIGGNADDASSQANVCSQIIAKTIVLHGTPHLGNDCDGTDIEDLGQFSVRLIL